MKLQRTGFHPSEKAQDLLICVLFIVFSFLVWWPSRYYPYFWDSAGYVIKTAQDILTRIPFSLVSLNTNFAHPPLITGLLALTWKLFGTSQLVSHLFMFPFMPLYLISTYYLSKKYLSRPIALLVTFLIAFSPAVLAEYLNIYIDLPSAALAITGLCLFAWNKPLRGLVVFSLAVLTKLNVITVLPFIYFQLKPKQRWLLLIPLLLIAIWLIYHQHVVGWLLVEPIRKTSTPRSFAELWTAIVYVMTTFFVEQAKWMWSSLMAAGLLILGIKRTLTLKSLYTYRDIISALLFSLFFFIVFSEFAPRYALYFLPLFAILVGIIIQKVTRVITLNSIFLLGIVLLLPLTQMLSWRNSTEPTTHYEFNPPNDLSIIDMIRVFRELSSTIEVIAPDAQVYGGFPEVQMLTEPIQGYVGKPLVFNYCDQFVYTPDTLQLLIVHPYAPSQLPCRALLDKVATSQLQHFEKNGKWVELYQVVASSSAIPATKNSTQ